MIQIPNQLKVKQTVELFEIFTGFETGNKYEINESNGSRFLFAREHSGILWKFFMSANRPCEIHLMDENKQEHFLIKRNFFFFFSSYQVFSNGSLIGKIKRNFAFFSTKYTLSLPSGEPIAKIEGPFWRPWTFNIKNLKGEKIGLIGKKFSGAKELFSDSDNFSFDVENSVDQDLRALVLAATFAVDFDNFDTSKLSD